MRFREGPIGASPVRTTAVSTTAARAALFLVSCIAYFVLLAGVAHASGGDPDSETPVDLVVTGPDGAELVRIDLSSDPRWHLAWHHSVTGILVRDFYAVRDGIMLLTHSHTPAFDAGLGHIPGRGRAESDGEGGYWIYDLDEPVAGNAYLLRVGSERVGHTLVHDGARFNLSDLAAGERVRIAVEVP